MFDKPSMAGLSTRSTVTSSIIIYELKFDLILNYNDYSKKMYTNFTTLSDDQVTYENAIQYKRNCVLYWLTPERLCVSVCERTMVEHFRLKMSARVFCCRCRRSVKERVRGNILHRYCEHEIYAK